MKWVTVTITLLLAVHAVGMPSTAWGAEKKPNRQLSAVADRSVDVDQVHENQAHDFSLWTFALSHFRIMVGIGPASGFGITIIDVDSTPIQVQTPTPEMRYKQGPDLDEDPWEEHR